MSIINKAVAAYLDELYVPINEELAKLRQQAEQACIPIITKDTEMFLFNLIRMLEPEHILEIGTAVGYSAACFAKASQTGKVTTIETDPETCRIASSNINRFGLSSRIRILQGDGGDVMEQTLSDECFDFIFIDAAKSHYKRFWEAAVKLCRPKTVIVSDNVLLRGLTASDSFDPKGKFKTYTRNMREYLAELLSLDYAETCVVPVGDGLAISRITRVPIWVGR